TYLSDAYEISVLNNSEITNTGRLDILTLQPKLNQNKELPEFRFRIDKKGQALDVDVLNVSKTYLKLFNKGDVNYSGHHAEKLQNNSRTFAFKIIWNKNKIFDGTVSCSINYSVKSNVVIGLAASASSYIGKLFKIL
ncbi:hypothetical protein, partial [Dehalococcoides sp. HCBD]